MQIPKSIVSGTWMRRQIEGLTPFKLILNWYTTLPVTFL